MSAFPVVEQAMMNRYDKFLNQEAGPGHSSLFMFAVIFIGAFAVSFVMWIIWFKDIGVTYPQFWMVIFGKIADFIMWPIRLLLYLFGLRQTTAAEIPIVHLLPKSSAPDKPSTKSDPNCPECKCDCKCPKCDIDGYDTEKIKPYTDEIRYLKHMVALLGKISLRENAVNSLYQEMYDPSEGITPDVTKLGNEYDFIKEQIRQDPREWDYFKQYFSQLSSVPSSARTPD